MSERYKSKYEYWVEGYGFVYLTCHFKFEKATAMQRHSPVLGGGKPICNGCGPSGYGAVVPDNILGADIEICGHIHNWGYQFGTDHEDKCIADETFGDNMDRIIRAMFEAEMGKASGGRFVKLGEWMAKRRYNARLAVAEKLYERAVRVFGKSAFWDKRPIAFTLDEVV